MLLVKLVAILDEMTRAREEAGGGAEAAFDDDAGEDDDDGDDAPAPVAAAAGEAAHPGGADGARGDSYGPVLRTLDYGDVPLDPAAE